MWVDADHIANQGVLNSLRPKKRLPKKKHPPLAARPKGSRIPSGDCHPDVVERVWDKLGGSLKEDCRCLVYGTPALVHPERGVVLAVCYGTAYCLRICQDNLPEALQAGASTTVKWSNGDEMNLPEKFGPDWVFGNWLRKERAWLKAVYDSQSL